MITCVHQGCDQKATHILVDYNHSIIGEHGFYCQQHAFDEEREECPCCDSYHIETDDENGAKVEFLPTYPQGTLDSDGCCSEHP